MAIPPAGDGKTFTCVGCWPGRSRMPAPTRSASFSSRSPSICTPSRICSRIQNFGGVLKKLLPSTTRVKVMFQRVRTSSMLCGRLSAARFLAWLTMAVRSVRMLEAMREPTEPL